MPIQVPNLRQSLCIFKDLVYIRFGWGYKKAENFSLLFFKVNGKCLHLCSSGADNIMLALRKICNNGFEYHLIKNLLIAILRSTKIGTCFMKFQTYQSQLPEKIENHIKKMKSKIYIENLKKYPEMASKLILKYDKNALSR